jgi:hypothetical protein
MQIAVTASYECATRAIFRLKYIFEEVKVTLKVLLFELLYTNELSSVAPAITVCISFMLLTTFQAARESAASRTFILSNSLIAYLALLMFLISFNRRSVIIRHCDRVSVQNQLSLGPLESNCICRTRCKDAIRFEYGH